MFKIQCNKLFKGEGKKKAFVSNHPLSSKDHASFTTNEKFAHVFTDMAICKNIRDDVLQVADSVTILAI